VIVVSGATALVDLLGYPHPHFVLDIGYHYSGAFAGQQYARSLTQTRGATGYDSYFVLNPAHMSLLWKMPGLSKTGLFYFFLA
jgi:predicted class III extradiol MEMO1 family dioxygenase